MRAVNMSNVDQSPSTSFRAQNGPQKLYVNLQKSPAATPKPRPLSSKNESQMMEVKEYEPETYAKDLHQCRLCSGKFTLSTFYKHYETEHRICFCVYCETTFESRIQLASHIESEHVQGQRYDNALKFQNHDGKQIDLMCVDCKDIFNFDLQLAEIATHHCEKLFKRCRHCKFPCSVAKLTEHELNCRARPVRNSAPEKPELTLTPLRQRPGLCKKCLQSVSPSRLAQHLKDCTGIPKPTRQATIKAPEPAQAGRNSMTRCARCQGRFLVSDYRQHKKECPGLIIPPPTPKERPEELVPLDPLLVEQDPLKRINMLITALVDYINVENKKYLVYNADQVPLVSVTLPENFKEKPVNWLLQHMIQKSSETCLYCRQAILIRVDKRQLILHLFINHRFEIKTSTEDNTVCKPMEPAENKTEIAAVVQELAEKAEILANSLSEVSTTSAVGEQLKSDGHLGNDHQQINSTTQETDSSTQPAVSGHSSDNLEVALINNSTPAPTVTKPVDWNVFELALLQQIFHSSDNLFCFDRGDVVFGQMPCDCLLCGQRIGSQLKLFAHWRVAHKGVAMRCAMCTGRFLFSGSLFSHHCFGTPQLFEAVRQAAIEEVTKTEGSTQSTQAYADGESSNSTMVLRYQCEFCGIQLPGFFNYMVHVRTEHNTCELCLETVEDQKLLERHHRRHKLQHFCWKCGIPYLAKPNYMTHLFWKHGAESKLCHTCLEKKWSFIYHFCLPPTFFTCETCKLQFTRPVCLLVHKRLHTNEKLRKCPSCPQMFISKKLLNKHVEATHRAKAIVGKTEGEDSCQIKSENKPVDEGPAAKADVKEEPMEEQVQPTTGDEVKEEEQKEIKEPDIQEPGVKMEETPEAPCETPTAAADVNIQTGEDTSCPDTTEPSTRAAENETEGPVLMETAVAGGEQADEQSDSPRKKRKSKKGKNFTSSLHGPNLSEEESDGEDDECDNESSQAEKPDVNDLELASPSEPTTGDQTSYTPPGTPTVNSETSATPTTPVLPVVDELKPVEPEPMELQNIQKPVDVCATPSTAISEQKDQSLEPEPRTPTPNEEPKTVSSLEESAISMDTAEDSDKPDDDFQAMSPLLPPLDNDFPDVPTLEDGAVNTQQHILNCLALDHDYSLPPPKETETKRKSNSPTSSPYDEGHRPHVKKLKIAKIKSPKRKDKNLKRRRHSSSSSSSSSSSCSSCGSNCSCSSSSSSDEESGHGHSHRAPSPMKPKKTPKLLLKKLKKPPPAKKPKAVKDPSIPKRPVGRPPKYPKDGPRPPPPKPKTPIRVTADQRRDEMLKHFKNKEDAYIVESDLETDLSDSEEKFYQQQLKEVIGKVPEAFDEIWKQSNEIFLLQLIKGVKNFEELRPKPKPKVSMRPQVSLQRIQVPPAPAPRPLVKNNSYKVVTKPEANGKQPKLKLRNVPLKKLYLVNTSVRNGKPLLAPSTQAAAAIRPPVLKSGFSQNMALNAHQQMRAPGRNSFQQAMSFPGSSRTSMGIQNNGRVILNKIHPNNMNSGQQGMNMNRQLARPSLNSAPVTNTSPVAAEPIMARPSVTITPIPKAAETVKDEIISTPEHSVADTNIIAPVTTAPVAEPVVENKKEESKEPKTLYCYCQSEDGDTDMIACDGAKCKHEWFHFRCVGVIVAPKGKWYCPDCRPRLVGKGKKSVSRSSLENRPKAAARNGISAIKGSTSDQVPPRSDTIDTVESMKNLSTNFNNPLCDFKPVS